MNPSVMEICSSALRGLIIAPPGKKLVIADLSNIEGRVLAWLAGETWKIKAFKDFDAKKGHDLYNLTYSRTFGIPVEEVTDDLRQIGKVMELAFGYQGGVGAWITFATAYGINLEQLADKAYSNVPSYIMEEANRFLTWTKDQKKSTFGLSDKAFTVCDSIKRMWRAEHPSVAGYWNSLEKSCISATVNPGETTVFGFHKIRADGAWLRILLPSGRYLCYPQPEVTEGKLSYMGMNQYTRKWSRLGTYGGKLCENITQAVARDILFYGGMNADAHGYDVILSVHDELLTETPDLPQFNVPELVRHMTALPIWACGLPLAAKGFESYRYKK